MRRRSRTLLLCVATVVLVAATGYLGYQRWPAQVASVESTAPVADDISTATMFDYKPTLLVVGDSFAGGTGDPSFPVYPTLVADRMGWNLALDAQGATGFVNGTFDVDPPHVPFIDRLDRDAATYYADYILIDGGRNDLGLYPETVVPAVEEYIRKVRAYWPDATLIVMLPAYASTRPAENFPPLADTMRRVADEVGAYVIDPVGQRWYEDIDLDPLLWNDGVHLNGPGNQYYADRIIENLAQMGIAP